MVVTYYETEVSIGAGLALVLFSITISLKMISFIHFNYHLKRVAGAELEKHVPSLANLQLTENPNSLFQLWYFFFAPTLCYQLEYPRSPKIR